jgi:hypothetical protein
MDTIPTPTNIRDLLVALGSTSEQVATTLLLRGIRGKQGKAASCPIANYLGSFFPGYNFSAIQADVFVFVSRYVFTRVNGFDPIKVPNPVAVADFVFEFDRGYHPELQS